MWPRKKGAPAPYSFMPEPVDFLGQQAGPVEDELKTAFLPVIAATPTVQSAYLARVYRSKAPKPSVAVCIRSSIGEDVKVEDKLTAIFKSRFRGDQRLDFLFLLEEEEIRLRSVCPPFYEKHA
jgi:hypothetical protein